MKTLPYFTANLPGIGGRIKQDVEDFLVEEVPLEAPSGRGSHLRFKVRKAGLPTLVAVDRIARFMGLKHGGVHVAGLKDAYAVTEQWMSIEDGEIGLLKRFQDGQIRILEAAYHDAPLRPGMLAGNRFVVRIRGAGGRELPDARAVLDVLTRRGVPNFFGEQRFGSRGDTGELGEAMVRNDLGRFVRLFLGGASQEDPPEFRLARSAFDRGDLGKALSLWPRHCYNQRKALAAYMRKQNAVSALAAIDKRLRGLYVSAYQSELFNEVLCTRLEGIDSVLAGDLVLPVGGGRFHVVKNVAAEQA
ncbi:MAG: tRNA pseudouridine(13) synthase TruD, partial [Planctomycetota bacterium]|nr:tRNA pseudouridine(13) synthase TruD [Planctomycetota bacterium]